MVGTVIDITIQASFDFETEFQIFCDYRNVMVLKYDYKNGTWYVGNRWLKSFKSFKLVLLKIRILRNQ